MWLLRIFYFDNSLISPTIDAAGPTVELCSRDTKQGQG